MYWNKGLLHPVGAVLLQWQGSSFLLHRNLTPEERNYDARNQELTWLLSWNLVALARRQCHVSQKTKPTFSRLSSTCFQFIIIDRPGSECRKKNILITSALENTCLVSLVLQPGYIILWCWFRWCAGYTLPPASDIQETNKQKFMEKSYVGKQ